MEHILKGLGVSAMVCDTIRNKGFTKQTFLRIINNEDGSAHQLREKLSRESGLSLQQVLIICDKIKKERDLFLNPSSSTMGYAQSNSSSLGLLKGPFVSNNQGGVSNSKRKSLLLQQPSAGLIASKPSVNPLSMIQASSFNVKQQILPQKQLTTNLQSKSPEQYLAPTNSDPDPLVQQPFLSTSVSELTHRQGPLLQDEPLKSPPAKHQVLLEEDRTTKTTNTAESLTTKQQQHHHLHLNADEDEASSSSNTMQVETPAQFTAATNVVNQSVLKQLEEEEVEEILLREEVQSCQGVQSGKVDQDRVEGYRSETDSEIEQEIQEQRSQFTEEENINVESAIECKAEPRQFDREPILIEDRSLSSDADEVSQILDFSQMKRTSNELPAIQEEQSLEVSLSSPSSGTLSPLAANDSQQISKTEDDFEMKEETSRSDLQDQGPLELQIEPQPDLTEDTLSQISNENSQDHALQAQPEISQEHIIRIEEQKSCSEAHQPLAQIILPVKPQMVEMAIQCDPWVPPVQVVQIQPEKKIMKNKKLQVNQDKIDKNCKSPQQEEEKNFSQSPEQRPGQCSRDLNDSPRRIQTQGIVNLFSEGHSSVQDSSMQTQSEMTLSQLIDSDISIPLRVPQNSSSIGLQHHIAHSQFVPSLKPILKRTHHQSEPSTLTLTQQPTSRRVRWDKNVVYRAARPNKSYVRRTIERNRRRDLKMQRKQLQQQLQQQKVEESSDSSSSEEENVQEEQEEEEESSEEVEATVQQEKKSTVVVTGRTRIINQKQQQAALSSDDQKEDEEQEEEQQSRSFRIQGLAQKAKKACHISRQSWLNGVKNWLQDIKHKKE